MISVKKQVLSLVMAVLVVMGFAGVFAPSTVLAADTIGYVNYAAVFSRHPDYQSATAALQLENENAQKEFESKRANLDETALRNLQNTLTERVGKREQALFSPIDKSVRAAINSVAKAAGVTVVLRQEAVVVGGKDLTNEAIAAVSSKK